LLFDHSNLLPSGISITIPTGTKFLTMAHKRKNKDYNPHNCGVTHFLNRLGSKWKVLIIYGISLKTNRFSSLRKAIPAISKQSLVNLLKELEEDKIIERHVYSEETPVKVEYALTEYGYTYMPVMRVIEEWGQNDMKKVAAI
jgi:DNA-binding HxlR family transcriptional regulator